MAIVPSDREGLAFLNGRGSISFVGRMSLAQRDGRLLGKNRHEDHIEYLYAQRWG